MSDYTSLPRRAPQRSNRGRNIVIGVAVVAAAAIAVAGALIATRHSNTSVSGTSGGNAAGGGTPSAAALVADFKSAGLPVGSTIVWNATTDPNHLLGRPGYYTSMTSWGDTRISASQARDTTSGAVDLGGDVEVFADASDAQARASYIASVLKAMPMLGAEYDYVIGDVLVRVSGVLTPSQASGYQAAAQRALG